MQLFIVILSDEFRPQSLPIGIINIVNKEISQQKIYLVKIRQPPEAGLRIFLE